MNKGDKVETLVDIAGIPAGTKGTVDEGRGVVTPEKVMVRLATGGVLYYLPEELKED